MQTDEDIKRIAEGLTKAQREAMLALKEEATQSRSGKVVYASLRRLGLGLPAGDWMRLGRQYALTPLGLRVRTYLQDKSHD